MHQSSYKISLPQFEGPFDLLLFFIERDELDIYNIPITKIINDFLDYIHQSEELNIELSSEFILFVSTLMRIKAKMLLPRKEVDAQGQEVDPRNELVNKLLEYKRFKEAAAKMSELESLRLQRVQRGNVGTELLQIGEWQSDGAELQSITLFKLVKAFERALQKYHNRKNRPVHTVVKYNYTSEEVRDWVLLKAETQKTLPFDEIFSEAENRVHAIFIFLSILDLVQQKFLNIYTGEHWNSFIIEYVEPESRVNVNDVIS
ncbi:MAG: segregation/condensation protein A [Chitinophagaceae bacterium]|nr:segregation/condensation protein A [Chitinophagaceae bacterium]